MSRHITCGQHISGTSQSHIKKPDIFAVVHVVETNQTTWEATPVTLVVGGCFCRMFLVGI